MVAIPLTLVAALRLPLRFPVDWVAILLTLAAVLPQLKSRVVATQHTPVAALLLLRFLEAAIQLIPEAVPNLPRFRAVWAATQLILAAALSLPRSPVDATLLTQGAVPLQLRSPAVATQRTRAAVLLPQKSPVAVTPPILEAVPV